MRKFASLLLLVALVAVVRFSLRAQATTTVAYDLETKLAGWQAGATPQSTAAVKPQSSKTPSLKTLALQVVTQSAARYQRVEFQVETDLSAANPFDPTQADLWVRLRSPSGRATRIPAFWYQDFDRRVRPLGAGAWRVRFTPNEVGLWSARAEIGAMRSKPISFTVKPSTAPGFVRIHPQNPRYFAFENDDLYVPIGLNIAWSTQQGAAVLEDYEHWFDRLSANGGNTARIWMADWSFGIEWNEAPLGDYSQRLDRAWLLDQVFQMAEQRGIYIMLTLLHHGPFSQSVNPQWDQNPYNIANGGMLKNPAEFVTNPAARDLFKRRLRYIAARWGYSTSLFAWEWWNEVNWTPIGDRELISWSAEMAGHLRQFDPYRHLITSSYASGSGHQLWQEATIDFTQEHDYTGNDPIEEFAQSYQSITAIAPQKPILLGEHGRSAGGADEQSLDTEIIHLHNGIWAAPFLGYAGSGMYWWWDGFIDPAQQWGQFGSLAEFLKGENLPQMQAALPNMAGAKALLLHSKQRALLWVRSDSYNASEIKSQYDADILKALKEKRKLTDWKYEPPMISGVTVTVSGLEDGDYRLQWYDPQRAQWLEEGEVVVKDGMGVLVLPNFSRDLAVKIVQQ